MGRKKKQGVKGREGRLLERHKALPRVRVPTLNISHRRYIFCNCPSGVALRLLHPRVMHQCNIRMTNKPFFYKAGERRFESYMGGKKSTGPKTPLSAYTEKEDSYG